MQYRTSGQYRTWCEIPWRDAAVPRSGWFRKLQSALGRRRDHRSQTNRPRLGGPGAALTAGGAVMISVASVVIVAFASPSSHAAPVSAARAAAAQGRPVAPLRVVPVTRAAGAKGVNGAAPIRVRFSAPLVAGSPMPVLWPHTAGSWQVEGDTAVFNPRSRVFPGHRVPRADMSLTYRSAVICACRMAVRGSYLPVPPRPGGQGRPIVAACAISSEFGGARSTPSGLSR
jgi:hypothetical protein